MPSISSLLGDEGAAAVFLAAAAAAAPAGPRCPGGAMPFYTSMAQALPASIKVHTAHSNVSAIAPTLTSCLAQDWPASAASAAPCRWPPRASLGVCSCWQTCSACGPAARTALAAALAAAVAEAAVGVWPGVLAKRARTAGQQQTAPGQTPPAAAAWRQPCCPMFVASCCHWVRGRPTSMWHWG
ncbi:hypothetical protein COO60DRAFT_1699660, partial [Scenedesmus sp. NREL 46B-D3]